MYIHVYSTCTHSVITTTIDYIHAAICHNIYGYTVTTFTPSPSISLSLSLPPPRSLFLSYIHTLTHSVVHLSEVALELRRQILNHLL